jgi:hypothetical protein
MSWPIHYRSDLSWKDAVYYNKTGKESTVRKTPAVLTIIFLILALASFCKFLELQNAVVDGDGIGVYFLCFEINDRVPNEEIPIYAHRFLNTALILTVVAVISGLAGVLEGARGDAKTSRPPD